MPCCRPRRPLTSARPTPGPASHGARWPHRARPAVRPARRPDATGCTPPESPGIPAPASQSGAGGRVAMPCRPPSRRCPPAGGRRRPASPLRLGSTCQPLQKDAQHLVHFRRQRIGRPGQPAQQRRQVKEFQINRQRRRLYILTKGTGRLAVGDQAGEDPLQAAAVNRRAGTPRFAQSKLQIGRQVSPVALGPGRRGRHEAPQPGRAGRLGGQDAPALGLALAQFAVKAMPQQRLLDREMLVQRAFGDIGDLRDALHRHRFVALGFEQGPSRVGEMIQLLQAFALATAGFDGINLDHDELLLGRKQKGPPNKNQRRKLLYVVQYLSSIATGHDRGPQKQVKSGVSNQDRVHPMSTSKKPSFQEIILRLQQYWSDKGCALLQPYDMEVGAGTSHTATFLRAIGPEPWKAAYVQPSRRPKDGRYGENPNRLQHYYQYQVVLKPAPSNILELYLGSLEALGFDLKKHDIRFVEDDWENPTLGAWGLDWEVWLNGMEVTQFTYFQQVGGLDCKPISGEITYGLERLAMYLQGVDNVYKLQWTQNLKYGDVYHQNEVEQSTYNFEHSDAEFLFTAFGAHEKQAKHLMEQQLALPAYEQVLKAAHTFNLLDARGAISVTERAAYIGRIRNLARAVAQAYLDSRERLGFPMAPREWVADLPKKEEK